MPEEFTDVEMDACRDAAALVSAHTRGDEVDARAVATNCNQVETLLSLAALAGKFGRAAGLDLSQVTVAEPGQAQPVSDSLRKVEVVDVVAGGRYRNGQGVELVVVELLRDWGGPVKESPLGGLNPGRSLPLGAVWIVELDSDLFGPTRLLAAPQGLAEGGYELIAEPTFEARQ